jgi:hypothetical protein
MDTASKVKQMELTRDSLASLKNKPVRYFSETLNMVLYFKRLKIRKVLDLIGGVSERSPTENAEAVLKLAAESIVDRNGNRIFADVDELEDTIGHVVLEIQEPLFDAQGLGTTKKS